jgi:hypothetical protein
VYAFGKFIDTHEALAEIVALRQPDFLTSAMGEAARRSMKARPLTVYGRLSAN